MNSVSIIGRIGGDISLRYLPSGKAVASFSIAVDQSYKKDGQKVEKTSWFDIVAFNGAEAINQYFNKGSKIGITGELEQQTWQDQNGGKRSKVIIKLRSFDFIDKNTDNEQPDRPKRPDPEVKVYDSPLPEVDDQEDSIPF